MNLEKRMRKMTIEEHYMKEAIRQAIERADIVILTGGLGPTKDDLTKEVTAKVFGRKLYMDEHSKARIRDYFEKIKSKKVTENNWKQALVPEGAIVIDNLNGTAPGLILEDKERGKAAILIPGPPNEMKPMFEHDIAPYLNKKQPEGIYSHMVKVCGIGESRAETMVADLMDAQTNPTLAPYAKTGEVHFRVTARACSEEEAEKLMQPIIEEMKKRFGDAVYTTEEEVTLEESVIRLLEEKKMTVTTAESCTGGKLSGRLLNVSGASNVYNGNTFSPPIFTALSPQPNSTVLMEALNFPDFPLNGIGKSPPQKIYHTNTILYHKTPFRKEFYAFQKGNPVWVQGSPLNSGSRIASVLRTSATAYAVYLILSLNARIKSNTRSARA